jgi:hypothetical protein
MTQLEFEKHKIFLKITYLKKRIFIPFAITWLIFFILFLFFAITLAFNPNMINGILTLVLFIIAASIELLLHN